MCGIHFFNNHMISMWDNFDHVIQSIEELFSRFCHRKSMSIKRKRNQSDGMCRLLKTKFNLIFFKLLCTTKFRRDETGLHFYWSGQIWSLCLGQIITDLSYSPKNTRKGLVIRSVFIGHSQINSVHPSLLRVLVEIYNKQVQKHLLWKPAVLREM